MAAVSLIEIGVALTGIAIAGALALRVGVSVIPAYIVVGILIGPNVPASVGGIPLTLVEQSEFLDVLAELGVVFLLFFLGLEFSIDQLLRDRNRIVTIGSIDFVINFGLGLALGFAFGYSILETLFIAGIVYISSSAVITKSLIDSGWIANAESNPILGTLVFEDLLIAVYLALLSAVALGEGGALEALRSVGFAFVFLGALTVSALYGTAFLERIFETDSDELFLLRVLGVTILVAGLALAAGLSEAVAAFFVGTAFGATDHVQRIERVVAPTRDFFAAIFFFAIGLATDVTLLPDVAWLLLAAIVVTTVGKVVSGSLSGPIYGLDRRRSMRVGLGLVPRGEFSLVLAALATSVGTGALGSVVPAFAVGYVLVMSIVGTVLMQNAGIFESLITVDDQPESTG
ncbi:MAG: cation:proton antiporter [Halanaeroarchaeum sp.]